MLDFLSFYSKAFWGFIALTGALIIVIYRLFNGNIGKDFELLRIRLDDLKDDLDKISKRIDYLEQSQKSQDKISLLLEKLIIKIDKKKFNEN
jgi:hypothetical protein